MTLFHIKEYGKKHRKVIFLLAGWQNRLWMYWLFSKILERNGYYCITYAYDNSVFSPDTTKTVENVMTIAQDILHKIQVLKQDGYTSFSIFGTSLGSVIALLAANQSPDITKIILNTTGASIAESVWSWDNVVPDFKKSLLNQQYTIEKLDKVWKSISPLRNIHNLHNKKILLYLAKNDEMIPYALGEKLVQELKRKNYAYEVITNNQLPHFFAGAKNLFDFKKYLSFLNNN